VYHGVLAFSPRTDFEGETSGGDGQHFPIHETLHTLMPLLLDGLLDQALDSPLASLRPGDQAHGSSRRQSQRTHGFLLPARNPWESLIVRNKRDELARHARRTISSLIPIFRLDRCSPPVPHKVSNHELVIRSSRTMNF
jgi:hypothetical protein